MTITVRAYGLVMAMEDTPDPRTCTHEEWERYMGGLDVFSMSDVEAAEYRAALEAYGLRLDREQRDTRDRQVRLLDERDRAHADAEDLSQRYRRLQDEVLRQGDVVLSLHRQFGADDERVVEARQEQTRLSERLESARLALVAANADAMRASGDLRNY